MNICITGGAGYTGTALAAALLDIGHKVTCLDNMTFGYQPILHLIAHPNFSVMKADVRDEALDLSPFDAVFHLAGISGHPACEANPGGAHQINVGGTANVVKRLSPSQLLINASTTSFYGAASGESRETDDIKPVNLYGETKWQAEKICMSRENSISLRWATVFGVSARMRHDLMVNDFVRRALTDRVIVLYDPDSMRTFIHIADLVFGYLFALENADAMRGEVYNMGSRDLNYTKRQIAEAVAAEVPCEIIVAQTGDKDPRNFIARFDKVRMLGLECERTLKEGVSELAKLYRVTGGNP